MFGMSAFAAIIQAVAMLFLPKVYSHGYKLLEHPFFKVDNENFFKYYFINLFPDTPLFNDIAQRIRSRKNNKATRII